MEEPATAWVLPERGPSDKQPRGDLHLAQPATAGIQVMRFCPVACRCRAPAQGDAGWQAMTSGPAPFGRDKEEIAIQKKKRGNVPKGFSLGNAQAYCPAGMERGLRLAFRDGIACRLDFTQTLESGTQPGFGNRTSSHGDARLAAPGAGGQPDPGEFLLPLEQTPRLSYWCHLLAGNTFFLFLECFLQRRCN